MELFLNDTYKALAYLYDNRGEGGRVVITQQELADALNLGRTKTNGIMQELKREGFIVCDGKRIGRYTITQRAMLVLKSVRAANRSLVKA